jgi:competence protein ComEC
MWGIITWVPIIERWLKWVPNRFEMRTTLSMTLAATFTTAPYQAWSFGQLTFAGLVTNVLALPLVPFVMGWGMATAIWGNMVGHELVSVPTQGLVAAINFIASLADRMPWAQFEFKNSSLPIVATIYLLLVYFAGKLSRKNELSTRKMRENGN